MTNKEAIKATERIFKDILDDARIAVSNLEESAGNYNALLVYAQDLQTQGVKLIRLATRLQTLEATANLK